MNLSMLESRHQILAIVQQPVLILAAVMTANVTMGTRVMVQRVMTLTSVHFFCTIVQNIPVASMRNHSLDVIVEQVTINKLIFVSILTNAVASMRLGLTFLIQYNRLNSAVKSKRVQPNKVPS